MKNSKSALAILILLISSTMVYSQNFSRLKREEGLVMYRVPDSGLPATGIMDFYTGNSNFLYMRATAESDSLNPNNLILMDSGLLAIGQDDDCSALTVPDFGDYDVKLYVDGDIAVSSGNATSIVASDERLKQNIQPLANSLEVIRQSNFVQFQYNDLSGMKTDKTYYGVVAQEMQQVLPSTVMTSSKRFRPSDKEATEFLMFNPNDLIYSGLNAIKELDEENQTLKNEVNELQEKVDILEEKALEQDLLQERVDELESLLTQLLNQQNPSTQSQRKSFTTGASLSQNAPNPLHESTDIEYALPEKYTSAALVIQDLNGRQIAEFNLNEALGKITFRPQSYGLGSGTYTYSLVVDGNITDTKKMVFFE